MKNITLSADEKKIALARKRFSERGTTLNQEFRNWLDQQTVSGEEHARRFRELMRKTRYVNAGRKFTREEMNER